MFGFVLTQNPNLHWGSCSTFLLNPNPEHSVQFGFEHCSQCSEPDRGQSNSRQWFWSAQTLERYSLPGWVFTHSCQWFPLAQTQERDSLSGWVFTHSCQWFQSAQTLKMHSLPRQVFTHSHQCFWSAPAKDRDSLPGYVFTHFPQWFSSLALRVTHTLDECSAILISSNLLIHIIDLQPGCSFSLSCE